MLEKFIKQEGNLIVVENNPLGIRKYNDVDFNQLFNKLFVYGMNYINFNVPIGRIRNQVVKSLGLYLKGELDKDTNPLKDSIAIGHFAYLSYKIKKYAQQIVG